ncbi:hypothetical protein Y032_0423g1200 [Ancylostoma ceylanicum]|uniref:Uncharacterized protein n=1 Tax=Ancylostoma ceylanicum TaxID=53326 RepID=A0A016X245_9BILA|nr:hypothetical protein Y032_0423g1200 [Ancylostoma ceylanicum]
MQHSRRRTWHRADSELYRSVIFALFNVRNSEVLKAVCALSCAFAGVDATSYLFEESKNPRKKVPVLLPMLVTFLSLFFFVVVMIFSLSTDVSKLPENVLVPEMFSVLNVPAAKVHYEAGFQRMRFVAN